MNWNTEVAKSNFDAVSGITNAASNRSDQRGTSSIRTHNEGGREVSNLDTTVIVGMNANEAGNMRNAINEYCDDIMNYLKGLGANEALDPNKAFKSEEVNAALNNYIERVREYCSNLVSQMKAFSDKLADVEAQWNAAASSMAQNINSSSSSFATGTTYDTQH